MRPASISRLPEEAGWREALLDLARQLREAARASLAAAVGDARLAAYALPVGRGAGDVTFDVDRVCEAVLERWLDERARSAPLSLLSEDHGWRHRGPGLHGVRDLPDFDHGGPRISVDPVDGTRHLMADLRSAWSVIGWCGPGRDQPRMSEVRLGIVSEIPDTRAALARRLWAERGRGARYALLDLATGESRPERPLATDGEPRVDNGYFPFFAYHPRLRPRVARLAARFFERLGEREGAALESCYDDQYISSGGQLALLAMGTYRAVVDLRHHVAALDPRPTTVAKAYDLCGAVLCAREAGCVVHDARGAELDFPIDAHSPIDFVGWANRATAERLAPHLEEALRAEREGAASDGERAGDA